MINCDAEEHVPIPTREVGPFVAVREKAAAACRTAKRMMAEGYENPAIPQEKVNNAIKNVANSVAKGVEPSQHSFSTALSTTEGAIRTHEILSEFDMIVVQDAKKLRNYVTNKLIIESENLDARIRIKALELLGKISDVGLFSERTEVTITNKSTTELENALKDKLRRLMGVSTAEDAEIIEAPVKTVREISVSEELEGL